MDDRSCQTSEVKPGRAWSVTGWDTAEEHQEAAVTGIDVYYDPIMDDWLVARGTVGADVSSCTSVSLLWHIHTLPGFGVNEKPLL